MTERVGQQLGNYRLTRLLGGSVFAEVYLGEHLRLGTQVAIKVLHTSLEDDDIAGFLREAQTVAHLKHPHIIRIFDFDVVHHTPFLVMDYLPNGNVRRSYPKGTLLPLTTIISYVKQVASALQSAHDEKMIHGDIKPENMLLDRDDTLVLSDFGIVLMAQSSRYQVTQEVAGTPAYMAPEQFRGHSHRASDQYALGVVVYEWLTGDLPFHGSFPEIARQHLLVPPPPLRAKVPSIPADVEQVVLTAMEKDPQRRFARVQAFATALRQACQTAPTHPVTLSTQMTSPSPPVSSTHKTVATAIGQPLLPTNVIASPSQMPQLTDGTRSAPPPALSPPTTNTSLSSDESQPPKGRISRRTVVVGLAGLTVVALGGGFTWLVSSRTLLPPFSPIPTSTSRSVPPSQHPAPTPLPRGRLLYTYRGHSSWVNAVAWSPDGTRIASGSGDHFHLENDYTVQVWDAADGGHVFAYRGQYGPEYTLAWSPDSKRIASGCENGTVQVWDAADGGNVLTYPGNALGVLAVAWSPNGRRIASGYFSASVQVWDAANGGNAFNYRRHSAWVSAVAWSPDSQRIASGSYDKTVQVWDAADGGHVFTYHGHSDTVRAVAWSPDGKRIASGSDDGTVQVWDAADGGNVFTYKGHSNYVNAAAWSPDGKRIASGSDDGTVQVWDAATGKELLTYLDFAQAVAWSPDGTRIASGGQDTTVRVWMAE